MKFEDLGLTNETLNALTKMGYNSPTEVQEKVVPLVIEGKNVVARSKTGTGKTASFGIGIVERLVENRYNKALILAPTRELVSQVSREIKHISSNYPFKIVEVYGGISINPQIESLRRGVDILVATPGRLLDHADRRTVDLSKFAIVILDEADRMLDMGFKDEMDRVMALIPDERTVLLFSATLDEKIMNAASLYMQNPHIIEIGEKEKPLMIKEEYIEATTKEKFSKLKEILYQDKNRKTIIFTSTKYFADLLAEKLHRYGFNADRLQGDMSQAARERVLERFKSSSITILVATDVAARGLHVDDVGLIVNYDEARDEDTHLHRVGRTGRMGTEGKAITFVSRRESRTERYSDDHPDFAWMKQGVNPTGRSSYSDRRPREDSRPYSGHSRRPDQSSSPRSGYGSRDSSFSRKPYGRKRPEHK